MKLGVMDRRNSNRLSVRLGVFIHLNGNPLGQFETRDISPNGVFLNSNASDLQLGARVDLTFMLSNNPDDRRKVMGMVVRRSPAGTAYMYADDRRQIFTRLQKKDLHRPSVNLPTDLTYPSS